MRFEGDYSYRASIITGRPGVSVALAFIAGIIARHIALTAGLHSYVVLLTLIFFMSAIIFSGTRYFSSLILITFLFIGFIKYQHDLSRSDSLEISIIAGSPVKVLIWGKVADRPRIGSDRARFTVDADSICDGTNRYPVAGSVMVYARPDARYDKGSLNIEYGDYILTHGMLEIPAGRRNPYEPDFNRFLELHGISAVIYVRGYYNIEYNGSAPTNLFMKLLILPARFHISNFIDRNMTGESAHFMRGLLLGDRSRLGDGVIESFIGAGVMHILAVSGLHVGILTIIFFSSLGILRIPVMPRIFLTIAGLLVYMFIAGAAPSIVRATVMATIILLGFVLQRKSDIYNSISVAALILLFFDTRDLFKPSFQLSFIAVLSIVYLYPRLRRTLFNKFSGLEENWLKKYAVQLILISLAAQIGTLPFTAYYFERISLTAVAVNLIVIPGVFFSVSFGLTAIIFGMICGFFESLYGSAAELLLSALLISVDTAARFPFASFEVYNFGITGGLIFYSVLAIIVHINDPGRFKKSVIGFLIVINICLIHYNISFDADDKRALLTIIMLDVGQGDALYIEFPNGQNILYDAGPRTDYSDAGENIVLPFLKRHGVRHLDALVISHAHYDHYGGAEAVIGGIGVGGVYISGFKPADTLYNSLHEKIVKLGIPVQSVQAGDIIPGFDNARVYVIHPSPAFITAEESSVGWNINNTSVVLMLVYGDFRFLITGDAEIEAEYYMVNYYGDFMKSRLLKAGHHGSNTSSSFKFIDTVDPEGMLISAGRLNRFNHPSTAVLTRLSGFGIDIYRTDIHGGVIVRSCGRAYSVRTMR